MLKVKIFKEKFLLKHWVKVLRWKIYTESRNMRYKGATENFRKNLEDAIRNALAVLLRLNEQSVTKFALAPPDKGLDKAKANAFTDLKQYITKHHEIMVAIRPFLRALACVSFSHITENKA